MRSENINFKVSNMELKLDCRLKDKKDFLRPFMRMPCQRTMYQRGATGRLNGWISGWAK